jgi:hypothetical protein
VRTWRLALDQAERHAVVEGAQRDRRRRRQGVVGLVEHVGERVEVERVRHVLAGSSPGAAGEHAELLADQFERAVGLSVVLVLLGEAATSASCWITQERPTPVIEPTTLAASTAAARWASRWDLNSSMYLGDAGDDLGSFSRWVVEEPAA